jgi:hypothetical protein
MAISDIRGARQREEGREKERERHAASLVFCVRGDTYLHSRKTRCPSPASAPPKTTVLFALALSLSLGLLLQGAACYANFWPLLTACAYLLFPMPSLFFAEAAPGFARWLTGFSTTAAAGIVCTLWHAGKVPGPAAALQVGAVAVLCGTWTAFDKLAAEGGGGGYGGGGYW